MHALTHMRPKQLVRMRQQLYAIINVGYIVDIPTPMHHKAHTRAVYTLCHMSTPLYNSFGIIQNFVVQIKCFFFHRLPIISYVFTSINAVSVCTGEFKSLTNWLWFTSETERVHHNLCWFRVDKRRSSCFKFRSRKSRDRLQTPRICFCVGCGCVNALYGGHVFIYICISLLSNNTMYVRGIGVTMT